MKAAILTVGTELVRGEIVDENAAWLASRLTSLGIDVVERCSVGDEKDRIAAAMTRLASQADVLLVTGGLGPTADDVTTEAAALALGVPLETDPAVLERIRQRWAARGRPMPPNNERQAMRPAGSRPIANPTGTAPGFSVTLGGCRVHVLPGVPSEMHRMYTEGVLPELSRSAPRNAHLVSLRVYGLAESEIDDRLADIERLEPGVRLGFRVRYPEVEVTIAARAENAAVAAVRAHAVASMVRARLGDAVYGEDGERLAAVVGRALRDRGWRLAVAESCTGGLLGALITSVPGSSDYLLLDAVVYSNASKQRVLGVPDELLRACGAVSAEV
ncbi:MAG: CinA family nicotinamide mononucleotide deamidase-related protein, partial [Myxococcota bacterium]|nr:CinA family nicotinamide mononucleotide deamidase-related protein [Myxococcota bacterium]